MSASAPPPDQATTRVDGTSQPRRPRRRTLQSGFSLLSRGEPKIWLTGGMLVICLTMIVGLLSLIAINGLATFWPRQVDWLVLTGRELDVGEPQAVSKGPSTTATGSEVEARPNALTEQPQGLSRFYRTANFDITGRHYRWFEPHELNSSGIVQPEWALVLERLSWGRLFGLPSRLSIPVEHSADSGELSGALATDNLMKEFAAQLEPLSASPSPTAQPSTDAPTDATAPEDAGAAPDSTTWTELTERIAEQLDKLRSQQLKEAMQRRSQDRDGTLMFREASSEQWIEVSDDAQLAQLKSIAKARVVWDDPAEILDRIAPVIKELSRNRHAILLLMRQVSSLDRRLSDARVAIRQAELDTGQSVLTEADEVGPLVERLVSLTRVQERLETSSARAPQDFADAARAREWQRIATAYRQSSVVTDLAAVELELDAWRNQFRERPPAIQRAVLNFERMWKEVLLLKQPLEQQILSLRSAGEGFELSVTVPTDAQVIELDIADSDHLKEAQWTAAAREALAAQGITPKEDSTQVRRLNDDVTVVSFDDALRGRQWLWQAQAEAASTGQAVWLLPPQRVVNCDEVVRIFPANRLSIVGKLGVYASRWYEFLLDDPREANTEGGVFPAIWGTVVMTLIMTLAVVPFGVIAALYLREYTRSGPLVSLVRISINNLAGVPSIVYGVFGLAFFCYVIGAYVDGGPKGAELGTLPTGSWYILLAATVIVGVAAFMLSLLSSGPDHSLSPAARWVARVAPWLWLLSLIGAGILIFKSPFFHGFYEARLPTPTFGKEGLLWAALTLALLTLPVVIVATEEALAAVPNSLREGSLACGASKWQTIYRIVLPHARPGILTGAILAMARGIGEVAPLMLVGALPVAPDLPLDTEFPYFHGSRSFMHLGYQIYWLGFQSQNSEASKPLVFTCTLLLILIVIALNLSAILLRSRLRRRFQGNQF